jgi:hypothetical protein
MVYHPQLTFEQVYVLVRGEEYALQEPDEDLDIGFTVSYLEDVCKMRRQESGDDSFPYDTGAALAKTAK